MTRKLAAAAIVGLALAAAAGLSAAAAADLPPAATTTQDFINGLSGAPPKVRTRGLSLGTGAAQPAPPTQRRVRFQVEFAFNSAELSPRATAVLDELGRALVSADLTPFRFQLTGHTDAKGRPEYNMELSQRRAKAVRDYLVATFGIADARLEAEGRGATMLLDPANPYAGINRRVEITNLGS